MTNAETLSRPLTLTGGQGLSGFSGVPFLSTG